MPSRLGYYPTPQAKYYATQRAGGLAPKFIQIAGPWGGYVPDLDPRQVDYRSAIDMYGLVPDGEILTYDYGWRRYESSSTRLPLGVNGSNVASTGASATAPLPVVGLARWNRQDASPQNIAIVCGSGSSTGLLWSYPDGGTAWSAVLPDASGTRITDTSEALFDWTNYAYGYGVTSGTGLLIATNNVNDVLYYPSNAGLTTYSSFPYGAGSLKASSCEVWNERLVVLNTLPAGGSRKPLELRWTEPSWSTPTAAVWTNVGAGALILKELAGVGLRLLRLGDVLACYTSDGVAVCYRTGQATSPIQLEYLSRTRGLLGRRSVVDLGGGVHFGLFTDGWFFLDRNGQWTEAGTANADATVLRKWAHTFYESLDFGLADRIDMVYDAPRGFIYIAWPDRNARTLNPGGGSGRNNRVWVFDLHGNRVWPDKYDRGFSVNQTPTCWGRFQELGPAAITWDTHSVTDTPWSYAGPASWSPTGWARPWIQFASPTQTSRVVHGSANGLVHQHSSDLYTRDGTTPTWQFKVHSDPLREPFKHKTVDRLWLEYVQTTVATLLGVTVTSANGENLASRGAVTLTTHPGAVSNAVVSTRVTATHPVFELVGSHPVILRALGMQVLPTFTDNVSPKGT